MKVKPILEACVETLEQALLAERSGADRIELCADLSVGGLTPNQELLEQIQKHLTIPIMAMARPRGGNFCYSSEEQEKIKEAINLFKKLKIKGVVFGFLTKKNKIDISLTKAMVAHASPLEVTFHKAIDSTPDPVKAVKELSRIKGVNRILTSGGKSTASEGVDTLRRMKEAGGQQLNIIVAGKVTKENLPALHQQIRANEYHGRRIVF
ncbi:MAG: copper homeostasis protein CutC [Bacteroidota bacterium]